MNIKDIASHIDHTNLKVDASESDILKLIREAETVGAASVCIQPSYVRFARKHITGSLKICTVVGFPSGYSTTEAKVFEAKQAVLDGADEIDMVINIGSVKNVKYDDVYNEISQIRDVCKDKTLKVIIETCMLTETEKINLCETVTKAKADYIKTSTGFAFAGAKIEDILLFKEYVGKNVKIKAAGGIKTIDQAVMFIEAGADRIGSSGVVIDLIKHKEISK